MSAWKGSTREREIPPSLDVNIPSFSDVRGFCTTIQALGRSDDAEEVRGRLSRDALSRGNDTRLTRLYKFTRSTTRKSAPQMKKKLPVQNRRQKLSDRTTISKEPFFLLALLSTK